METSGPVQACNGFTLRLPCTHEAATIILIKVKLGNVFLQMLLVCICGYLRAILRC
jgi:hypothetical protein